MSAGDAIISKKKEGRKARGRARRGKIISQPGLQYPEKMSANHPRLGKLKLSGLHQFRRKILAELDAVKADVNNIVAIARSKRNFTANVPTNQT